jgi:serine/threonine protein kinase
MEEVRKNGKLVEEKAIAYIQQIIRGYNSVHNIKVIHRQLDPTNILNAGLELKIADFSEAIYQQ